MRLYHFLTLTLWLTAISHISFSQTYEIDQTYQVNFSGTYSEEFDSLNSFFNLIRCNESLLISIQPLKPVNGSYFLYDSKGLVTSSKHGTIWTNKSNDSFYTVKDGDEVIFTFSGLIDTTTRYKVVLTDKDFGEITNFDPSYLNSIELSIGLKNLLTSETGYCVPFYNWFVNNTRINDISKYELKSNDTLCVFLDGTEQCTNDCFRQYKTCYILQDVLTSVNKSGLQTLNIHPSSASSEIRISNLYGDHKFQIFNSGGREVLSGISSGSSVHISTLTPGLYFIKIREAATFYFGKFIRE